MRRTIHIAFLVMAVVIGLAIAAVAASAWLFQSAAATTTRIGAYPQLLKDWSPTGLVDHFPRTIPTEAANVSLRIREPPPKTARGRAVWGRRRF